MAIDKDKKRLTFTRWYANHREEYNEQRRRRYQDDHDYREKQRKNAREYKRKQRAKQNGGDDKR